MKPGQFFGIAGGMLLGPMLRGCESELSPILKEFNGWVAAENPHTAQTLLDTWIERDLVRMQVFEQMERFPVLLCPVAAIPAFRHGERSWQVERKTVEYLDAWSYCEWFNLLGMPAASVPVSRSPEGLPIGVQVVARPWQEELVLSVSELIEEGCGFKLRPACSCMETQISLQACFRPPVFPGGTSSPTVLHAVSKSSCAKSTSQLFGPRIQPAPDR